MAGGKNYKFEHLWLTHPQLKQVVKLAWTQQSDADSSLDLQLRLITTGQTLMEWNKDTFGHLPNLIRKSTTQIKQAQHQCAIQTGEELDYWINQEKEPRSEHLTLLQCHATYWQQRSKLQWLQSGVII